MAYIKIMKERYASEDDVTALILFLAAPLKSDCCICGGRNIIGCVAREPDEIAEEFLSMQEVRTCKRRLYHIIVSFDPVLDQADEWFAGVVGQAVCDLYKDYQSVYMVHDDTDFLHVHIVLNNCPVLPDTGCLTSVFKNTVVYNCVDDLIDRHLGM